MSRFWPMPTEALRPTASRIAALTCRLMTLRGPTSRSSPETSRYASSQEGDIGVLGMALCGKRNRNGHVSIGHIVRLST
jgi:hypothetical protein